MDMSGNMSDMDHSTWICRAICLYGSQWYGSGMDHGSMDMSGMQGGKAPADARSPDLERVPHGRFGGFVMMDSLPLRVCQ